MAIFFWTTQCLVLKIEKPIIIGSATKLLIQFSRFYDLIWEHNNLNSWDHEMANIELI